MVSSSLSAGFIRLPPLSSSFRHHLYRYPYLALLSYSQDTHTHDLQNLETIHG